MQTDHEKEVEFLKSETERYKSMFLLLKREKYGSKSERTDALTLDQMIFNEIEQEAAKLPVEEETQMVSAYPRKKGRGKKKPFPEHWEREEVIIDLPEDEKICLTCLDETGPPSMLRWAASQERAGNAKETIQS